RGGGGQAVAPAPPGARPPGPGRPPPHRRRCHPQPVRRRLRPLDGGGGAGAPVSGVSGTNVRSVTLRRSPSPWTGTECAWQLGPDDGDRRFHARCNPAHRTEDDTATASPAGSTATTADGGAARRRSPGQPVELGPGGADRPDRERRRPAGPGRVDVNEEQRMVVVAGRRPRCPLGDP